MGSDTSARMDENASHACWLLALQYPCICTNRDSGHAGNAADVPWLHASPTLWRLLLCSQRTDMGVWTDMLADWARSLQSPDVEDPKSSAYRRIETLGQLLLRAMRLKVRCL